MKYNQYIQFNLGIVYYSSITQQSCWIENQHGCDLSVGTKSIIFFFYTKASSFSWFEMSKHRVSNIKSPHCLLLSIWKAVNECVSQCFWQAEMYISLVCCFTAYKQCAESQYTGTFQIFLLNCSHQTVALLYYKSRFCT